MRGEALEAGLFERKVDKSPAAPPSRSGRGTHQLGKSRKEAQIQKHTQSWTSHVNHEG